MSVPTNNISPVSLGLSCILPSTFKPACVFMYVHVTLYISGISVQLPFHSRYLMVNPKDYRVVVVEPLLCPTSFRNTLARAFFSHFSVRCMIQYVCILQSHVTIVPCIIYCYGVCILLVHDFYFQFQIISTSVC